MHLTSNRFAILSQLIVDFPHVLQAHDYQALLQLLTEYKPTIQHALHMRYFIRMAEVMLRKEPKLQQNSTSFCTEHWHKIMELSFKQAETDKTQNENVDFMRVLIDNKVIVSHDFIKNIMVAIAKRQTIRKSNGSIKLLMSVLQNVNVDMIDDINALKIAIIHWLSAKAKLSELRKVIENNNSTDQCLISELYVLCALSRQGDSAYKTIDHGEMKSPDDADVREHEHFINELVQCLQYRILSKLVVSDAINSKVERNVAGIEKLPEPNDLKASINEAIFNELMNAIFNTNDPDDIDDSIESFNNICSSLVTHVNILNSFVGYESLDVENFSKFFTKRIAIRIGQLDGIIKKIGNAYRIDKNANDVNEIVNNLLNIWHVEYHPIMVKSLFIVKYSESILKWLKTQLIPLRRPPSILMAPLKNANQLEFEERIQLKCLTLLAHFSAYQEDSDCNVFDAIKSYKFNLKRNEDLFMDFQLVKVTKRTNIKCHNFPYEMR